MTLPAYPGRHAFFNGTTVLPAAPPAGAPPGRRPSTVEAAFWVAVAQAVLTVVGSALVAFVVLAFALGYDETGGVLFAVALFLVPLGANALWLVLGWRARNGSPGARVGFAVLTGLGLLVSVLVCVAAWTTVVPVLGLVLHSVVLVLLFLPESNAWFRR